MADYAKNPTCEKIEKINVKTKDLLNTQSDTIFGVVCDGMMFDTKGVHYFKQSYLNLAKRLAQDAAANDPVLVSIQNLENSLNQLVTETNNILATAKLQDVYVTQCLLGLVF